MSLWDSKTANPLSQLIAIIMYCAHWQLKEPPFENVPDSRFVYLSAHHEEALMRLLYTVNGRKGACLLTGDIGCGKTTISCLLREKLRGENYQIAMVNNPTLGTSELLREILTLLEIPVDDQADKLHLIHALRQKLKDNMLRGIDSIIIIDEAHLIRTEESFEELRLLLNHHLDNRFLLTLILAGQPELKDQISKIPQFSQRIPIRYHLQPFNFVDTCKYIQFRMQQAGGRPKIFTAGAARKIFSGSAGIPRRINTICDMSLLAGFIEQSHKVDEAMINKVIAEEM